MVMTGNTKLLSLEDVKALTGASRDSIYRWMRSRGFPRPIKLGLKSNRWLESEVLEWVASLPRAQIGGSDATK